MPVEKPGLFNNLDGNAKIFRRNRVSGMLAIAHRMGLSKDTVSDGSEYVKALGG